MTRLLITVPTVWFSHLWCRPSLVLTKHGLFPVGVAITIEDYIFTTKIVVCKGADALALFRWVALLDTGCPQTSIGRDALDPKLSVGGVATACERDCAP